VARLMLSPDSRVANCRGIIYFALDALIATMGAGIGPDTQVLTGVLLRSKCPPPVELLSTMGYELLSPP
jgi:hypothetical protein